MCPRSASWPWSRAARRRRGWTGRRCARPSWTLPERGPARGQPWRWAGRGPWRGGLELPVDHRRRPGDDARRAPGDGRFGALAGVGEGGGPASWPGGPTSRRRRRRRASACWTPTTAGDGTTPPSASRGSSTPRPSRMVPSIQRERRRASGAGGGRGRRRPRAPQARGKERLGCGRESPWCSTSGRRRASGSTTPASSRASTSSRSPWPTKTDGGMGNANGDGERRRGRDAGQGHRAVVAGPASPLWAPDRDGGGPGVGGGPQPPLDRRRGRDHASYPLVAPRLRRPVDPGAPDLPAGARLLHSPAAPLEARSAPACS